MTLFRNALLTLSACETDSLPSDEPAGCDSVDPYALATLRADLGYLASPALDGRAPGTDGDIDARAFVAERFACIGLEGAGAEDDFDQPFTDAADNETGNVIGLLRGADAALASELVVISAHIDHFGEGLLGANDNASGVTALLAIATALSHDPEALGRTVVFAVFGSEESGFEGSEHFVTHASEGINPDDVVYNVNMDMVGSYSQAGIVDALGTFDGTAGLTAVEENTDAYPSLDVSLGYGSGDSDNYTFCSRGVPYIFWWTQDEECYHESCDTSGRIDYAGLSEIAQLTGDVTLALSQTSTDLAAAVNPGQDGCGSEE